MGHLASQPHVLPQEPHAARANVPYVGSEQLGGAMRDPADRGGCHLGVQEGCWAPPGTRAPVPERPRWLRAGQCHLLWGPWARPPPKILLLLPGGAPPVLASPPAGHHSAALLGPLPISTPSRVAAVAPGFLRPRGTVPASPVPPVPPPPPLSTSRCSQVKNVADGASVQDETATLAYLEKPTSPINAPPYSAPSYSYAPPNTAYYPSGTYSSRG